MIKGFAGFIRLASRPLLIGLLLCSIVHAAHKPAASISAAALVQPAALVAQLRDKSATAPVLLQVGSRALYDQGHIPGSRYAGPAGEPKGLESLHAAVASLAKDTPILIYCGCCPWNRCPNIAAAYDELKARGFGAVKVLYIAQDFGADWIDKGYPTESS
ncbi:MAG: rhodanese-like domain-containing protein [Proteobacteria bacterium]|nr:rhodanese-like domain-containing protein [Pseudomonadota bacterium]